MWTIQLFETVPKSFKEEQIQPKQIQIYCPRSRYISNDASTEIVPEKVSYQYSTFLAPAPTRPGRSLHYLFLRYLRIAGNFYKNYKMFPYTITAWKVSKYGVISGPYFPVFGLNTEILRIHVEYRKIRTRNKSAFGHFSRIVWPKSYPCDSIMRLVFVEGKSFSKFGSFVKNNVTQGGEI